MAERAHPNHPGFRRRWIFKLQKKRIIPWIQFHRNPYRSAFFWRYGYVAKYCRNKNVLDIPCGMGWGTSLLKGCKTLTGIDTSFEAIEEANYRYGKIAQFHVGSMKELEFRDKSFDLIACLEGIEHVSESTGKLFLKECYRVLKENGEFIVSSPSSISADHSGNPYHLKEYMPEELQALLTPHFNIYNVLKRQVEDLIVTLFHVMKQ